MLNNGIHLSDAQYLHWPFKYNWAHQPEPFLINGGVEAIILLSICKNFDFSFAFSCSKARSAALTLMHTQPIILLRVRWTQSASQAFGIDVGWVSSCYSFAFNVENFSIFFLISLLGTHVEVEARSQCVFPCCFRINLFSFKVAQFISCFLVLLTLWSVSKPSTLFARSAFQKAVTVKTRCCGNEVMRILWRHRGHWYLIGAHSC